MEDTLPLYQIWLMQGGAWFLRNWHFLVMGLVLLLGGAAFLRRRGPKAQG